MTLAHLKAQAETYLEKLCVTINNRRAGSPGNRAATDFFAGIVSSFGFETTMPVFDCIDWRQEGVTLTAGEPLLPPWPAPTPWAARFEQRWPSSPPLKH